MHYCTKLILEFDKFSWAPYRSESILENYSWQSRTKTTGDLINAFFCTSNGEQIGADCILFQLSPPPPPLSLSGKLHYLQEGGEHVERGNLEGKALFLCLHHTQQILAVVTNEMMLTQYSINSMGETTILMNVC